MTLLSLSLSLYLSLSLSLSLSLYLSLSATPTNQCVIALVHGYSYYMVSCYDATISLYYRMISVAAQEACSVAAPRHCTNNASAGTV